MASKTFSISLEEELLEKLKAEAIKDDRSRNYIIVKILTKFFEKGALK